MRARRQHRAVSEQPSKSRMPWWEIRTTFHLTPPEWSGLEALAPRRLAREHLTNTRDAQAELCPYVNHTHPTGSHEGWVLGSFAGQTVQESAWLTGEEDRYAHARFRHTLDGIYGRGRPS